jgi:hypothetical protein
MLGVLCARSMQGLAISRFGALPVSGPTVAPCVLLLRRRRCWIESRCAGTVLVSVEHGVDRTHYVTVTNW